VVTLTRMPSTTPINAPTPTKNHVPRTSSLIPIPIILLLRNSRSRTHKAPTPPVTPRPSATGTACDR